MRLLKDSMAQRSNIYHEHNGHAKNRIARVNGAKRHAKKKALKRGTR